MLEDESKALDEITKKKFLNAIIHVIHLIPLSPCVYA